MKSTSIYLVGIFLLLTGGLWGQTLQLSSVTPSSGVTVCDSARTFQMTVQNPIGVVASNVVLTLHLEMGQSYVVGSVNTADGIVEQNLTDLQHPVFSVPSFSAPGNKAFSFKITTYCDVIGITGDLQVEADLSYTNAGGTTTNIPHYVSDNYSKKYASISIISITNQNKTGSLNEVFTRVITIKNGGFGRLTPPLTFTSSHSGLIDITGVASSLASGLSWGNGAAVETYTMSDFSAIGNGDAYLDENEQFTITETVKFNSCNGSNVTNFAASWGCSGASCESVLQTATNSLGIRQPILTRTYPGAAYPSCVPASTPYEIHVTNTGTGPAVNLAFEVRSLAAGSAYYFYNGDYNDRPSALESNSIEIRKNGGAYGPATVLSTTDVLTNNTCFTGVADRKKRFVVGLDSLKPGESVTLRFRHAIGCLTACNNYAANVWGDKLTFYNECGNMDTLAVSSPLGTIYNNTAAVGFGPTDVLDGQIAKFGWDINTYESNFTVNTAVGYFEFVYDVPVGWSWSGNSNDVKFIDRRGWDVPPISGYPSYNGGARKLTVRYPFVYVQGGTTYYPDINRGQTYINLTLDCASALPGSPGSTIGMQLNVFNDPSCAPFNRCYSISTVPHCPSPCPEGIAFMNFTNLRKNYGISDNDDNGQPDPVGTAMDMSKVRANYFMQGDTMISMFHGIVYVPATSLPFAYAYASSNMGTYGSYLTSISSTVEIRRPATPIATVSITPTKSGNVFTYDFSSAVTGLDSLRAGDTIIIKAMYKAGYFQNGNIIENNITNEFYASRVANPTDPADKKSCDNFSGRWMFVSHYPASNGTRSVAFTGCNEVTDYMDFFLGQHPCCSNYAGGDIFRFEYRPMSMYDSLIYTVPAGYKMNRMQMYYNYTTGYGAIGTVVMSNVTPDLISGSDYHYNLRQYYTNGTWNYLDEGHYIQMWAYLVPDCEVPPTAFTLDRYKTTQVPAPGSTIDFSNWGNADKYTQNYQNTMVYTRPLQVLTSNGDSVYVDSKRVSWDFDIAISNHVTVAPVNFFSLTPTSGMTILNVQDITAGTTLTPVGGVYQLGAFTSALPHTIRITAQDASCTTSTISVNAGWSCDGYPASVAAFTCTPTVLNLVGLKDPSHFQVQILDNTPNKTATMDLCTNTSFRFKVRNPKVGYTYETQARAILPKGLDYITGSAEILYPLSDSAAGGRGWRSLDAPLILNSAGGSKTLSWSMDNLVTEPLFGQRGFPGVLNSDSSEFWIRFNAEVGCNYVSGSAVRFRSVAKRPCGTTLPQVNDATPKRITGVVPAYTAFSAMRMEAQNNVCNPVPAVRSTVKMLNPSGLTGAADHSYIILPEGHDYAGNFTLDHAPTGISMSGSPAVVTNPDGSKTIDFILPNAFGGTTDSLVFSFDVQVPDTVSENCGQRTLSLQSTNVTPVLCITSGTTCDVAQETSSAETMYEVLKPRFAITALRGQGGAISSEINVSTTIENVGASANTGMLLVDIYCDPDNNGPSAGDTYLGTVSTTDILNSGNTKQLDATFSTGCGLSYTNSLYAEMRATSPNNGTPTDQCACRVSPMRVSAILPITHALLSGNVQEVGNSLVFDAENGKQVARFEIQKERNGDWVTFGKEEIYGADFDTKRVAWLDPSPLVQEVYRVQITDLDGRFYLSNEVELNRTHMDLLPKIYPNPADDVLHIESPFSGVCELFDMTGRIIYSQKVEAGETSALHVGDYTSGVYIVKVASKQKEHIFKIVIE